MDLFGSDIEEEMDDIEEDAAEGGAIRENPFSHPRAMIFCTGHDAVEKNLLELYYSGRMPHAFVFSGPQGIGKATMAYRFARFLLKNGIKESGQSGQSGLFGDEPMAASLDVGPHDPVFRRMASGGHADFFSAEKKFDEAKGAFKDALDVEEIRKIAPFLRLTSSEGGWRAVIVDDADSMTRSAQNALLKILEEPPKNSVLILVTHRAGALVPTIRSRSRLVNFSALDHAAMKELLNKFNADLSNREMETLVNLSEGSFGRALHYIEGNAVATLGALMALMENSPDWKWLELHKLADTLSGAGSDHAYQTFQELMQWIMRQSARSRARGIAGPAQLKGFLKNSSLEQILKICENLESHFGRSDTANLDRRQTILGAFSLISA